MTDQQPPNDIGRLYRSVSNEAAPTELNETILRRAARDARRPRGSFLGRWPALVATSVTAGACAVWLLGPMHSAPTDNAPEQTRAVEDFAAAAADGRDRIREIGDAASAQIPAGDPSAAQSLHCTPEQTATLVAWSACIAALRDQGRDTAASEEMQRFFSVHGVKAPVIE
ncbi:MAG: hypothetical protein AAF417_01730 [Pseudomonadota bacterium]